MKGVGALSQLVEQAGSGLERVARELEPELLDGDVAVRLFGALARVVKLAEASQTTVARRIDECGAHRGTGHLSPAHLLAATAGVSLARASDTIRTGHQLVDQPGIDDSFRAGHLSLEQASAISDAVAADASAEQALLEIVPRETLSTLRQKTRAVCDAAMEDRLGRYRRQCASRGVWHRRDTDGMVRGSFAFPPDVGARFVRRLEAETDAEYRRAYTEGRREPHHCYRADTLARLVHGDATKPGGFDGDRDLARSATPRLARARRDVHDRRVR